MSAAQPTSAPATDPDVVVIGGGLAGLLAARRLSAAGQRVAVLEAGNRPRGMVAAGWTSSGHGSTATASAP